MQEINKEYQEVDISEVIQKYNFQGAILARTKDQIILEQGYGFADEENAISNTPNTVFRIGSISKQFTGAAILQLQERGLLSVDDTLDKYFPILRDGKIITIRQMLAMTAGFEQSFIYYKIQNESNMELDAFIKMHEDEMDKYYFSSHTKEEQLALLNEKPLLSTPGSTYHYSNIGYTLAAYIIEELSGLSYAEYMRKNIFEPYGLAHTFDYVGGEKAKDYNLDVNNMELDETLLRGCGGICSNVYDIYKWIHLLHSGRVLSENAYREMTGGTDFTVSAPYHYGYGLSIYKGIIKHGGGTYTSTSYYFYDIKSDMTVIVLSNHLTGKAKRQTVSLDVASEVWKQIRHKA